MMLCITTSVNAEEIIEKSDIEIINSDFGLCYDGFTPNIPEPDTDTAYTSLTSYDPRITNSKTPVKNQWHNGSCWAFSSIAVMESAVYKNTGLKYDYSEQALRYLASDQILNKIGENSDIGKYDKKPDEGDFINTALSFLTNTNNPISKQFSWISPNMEKDVPYTNDDQNSTYMATVSHLFDSYGMPLGIDTSYSNAYATDTVYISEAYIKDYILEYGGVFLSFCANTSNMNDNTRAFYNEEKTVNTSHAVEVVGWDDNYSRLNFKEGKQPTSDGAWLIKNSWGTDPTKNNDGYYWISYEDDTIGVGGDAGTITQVAPVSKNELMLSYDYTRMTKTQVFSVSSTGNTICMANVYDVTELADEYGSINKVMFYANDLGAFYRLYVVPMDYLNEPLPSPTNLNSPNAYGTVNFEGYITADFQTPITFDEDTEKIAIIIKFNTELEGSTTIGLAKESSGTKYNAVSFPGESYYYSNGTWTDITGGQEVSSSGNFCIRPTLVRRTPITQNSTLSSNALTYTGSDVTVNLNLNGNLLYSIKENGNTILYEDNQFTRTDNTVTFKSSYLSSLSPNQYKNIVFEFTDGASQTLKITRKVSLPSVSVSGKTAVGQTLTASLNNNASPGISYQWQVSTDGELWTDITGATSNTLQISDDMFLKYIRVKLNSTSDSVYYYPQEVISASTPNKIILYGDANLDGDVDISDSTTIQKYIAGRTFTAEQLVAADVNGDGIVNIDDATLINKYLSDLITSFPVESN